MMWFACKKETGGSRAKKDEQHCHNKLLYFRIFPDL